MRTVFVMPPDSTSSSPAPLEETVAALNSDKGMYAPLAHVVVDDCEGFNGPLLLLSLGVRFALDDA